MRHCGPSHFNWTLTLPVFHDVLLVWQHWHTGQQQMNIKASEVCELPKQDFCNMYVMFLQNVQVSEQQEAVRPALSHSTRAREPQLLHCGYVLRRVRSHRAHRDLPHRRERARRWRAGATRWSAERRQTRLR